MPFDSEKDRENLAYKIKSLIEEVGGIHKASEMTDVRQKTLEGWSDKRYAYYARFLSLKWLAEAAGKPIDYFLPEYEEKENESLDSANSVDDSSQYDMPLSVPEHIKTEGLIHIPPYLNGENEFILPSFLLKGIKFEVESLCWVAVTRDNIFSGTHKESYLIIDKSQNEILDGCVSMININTNLVIRHISVNLDGTVTFMSEGSVHKSENLNTELIQNFDIIGRVIYFMQKV